MRLLGLWGRGRTGTNPTGTNPSRSRRWRSSAAATAAFLAVVALSAVQINIYFGLNHTVGDLTGAAAARIQPLEAGLTRAAGAPAATGLAHWQAPADLPDGVIRKAVIPGTVSGFQSRDAYVYLPPAYLGSPRPALPVLVLFSGQPGGPADWLTGGALRSRLDRFAAEHAGVAPVTVVVDPNGSAVGKHAVHGQPDCPGGHLPGAGRAGLDQPHARRRPGSPPVGRGRLLLRRHVRHADGHEASRRLQRRAGLLQRGGAGPREGAGQDHRGLLRRRRRGLRPADPAARHGGTPLRRPRRVLRRRRPRPGVHRPHGRALRGGTPGRVHASKHTGSPTRGTPGTRHPAAFPAAWTSWPDAGGSRHEPVQDRQQRGPRRARGRRSRRCRASGARACAGRWRTSVPCPSRWRSSRPSSVSGPSRAASCPGRPSALLPVASVNAPGLKAGHWWSLFTSLFFATNLLAYLDRITDDPRCCWASLNGIWGRCGRPYSSLRASSRR